MFKIISFISLLFVVQTSLAECASTGCTDVSIDMLYVTTSGVVYINTSGDEKLLGCAAESGVFTTLMMGSDGSNAVFSTLLAAQASGKNVSVRTQDGSQGCNVLYVTLENQ
ncbi:MAG: hypothetical protein ACI8SR_002947 [Oceanicoccus sp.]|jgi:hypothetical protein